MKVWAILPARGGSRGVPRKNLRNLGGKPLIAHGIDTALEVLPCEQVIVITDSHEIASLAERRGVRAFMEPPTTGLRTLDDVARDVIDMMAEHRLGQPRDIFLTLQPTCPFLSAASIERAIEMFEAGAGSVLTVTDDRHLRWRPGPDGTPVPAYEARVNRQQMTPCWRETGGIIAARIEDIERTGTRIVEPVRVLEVSAREALDIDTPPDFALAEYFCDTPKVMIRVDGGREMGLGHVYRQMAVAYELALHSPRIVTRADGDHATGAACLERSPLDVQRLDGEDAFRREVAAFRPDILILDKLDTRAEEIQALRPHAGRILSFEDLGSGAHEVDLVINDLYADPDIGPHQHSGLEMTILAPAFETFEPRPRRHERVETVLLLFGGTDPAGLTGKALTALGQTGFDGHTIVVQGPGAPKAELSLDAHGLKGEVLRGVEFMPEVMDRADLAISSAGRTVTELTSMGIPTLVMCQNRRELMHTHAAMVNGVLNLGLGENVLDDGLARNIELLLRDSALRARMSRLALNATAGRSNHKCIQRILDLARIAPTRPESAARAPDAPRVAAAN